MTPLPFAPPPKDSSLYQQLESTTLQTLTADQLATIKAKTFSQGTEGNEDEYRRLLLLGLAADQLSLSGPIPNTGKVVQTVLSTSNLDGTIYAPAAGEVWQVIGVGLVMDSGVTSGTAYLKIEDASDASNAAIIAEMGTSGSIESFDNDWGGPIYIDENLKLIARYFKSGGFPAGDTVTYGTVLLRVR